MKNIITLPFAELASEELFRHISAGQYLSVRAVPTERVAILEAQNARLREDLQHSRDEVNRLAAELRQMHQTFGNDVSNEPNQKSIAWIVTYTRRAFDPQGNKVKLLSD